MKTLKLLLTLFMLGFTIQSQAYITKSKKNGNLWDWLFKDITESKVWDPRVNEFHYHVDCQNPGWNRCRFSVITDAQLVVNGTNIGGEEIENYFQIAENQIETGTLSGTIITANQVVIHWYGTDINNNTIGLYNIQEAVALGILPANYNTGN